MIGKLIGAMVGKRASKHVSGVNETGGALLGAAAVPIVRKLGGFGLIAMAAGGYAFKRHHDRKNQVTPTARKRATV